MRSIFAAFLAILFMKIHVSPAFSANIIARISLSSQTMTVSQNGIVRHRWKVSTARKGYVTPQGSWRAKWLSRNHRSRKYDNAPMPHAVFFNGGYAVHATFDLKRLGRPASPGCIRLHPANAAEFFSLTRRHGLKNTKIVVTRQEAGPPAVPGSLFYEDILILKITRRLAVA